MRCLQTRLFRLKTDRVEIKGPIFDGMMNVYIIKRSACHLKLFVQTRGIYYNHRLEDFPLAHNPKDVECNKNEIWEKKNYFNPSTKTKETFSMILPPPNVTGTLHLGHTLTATIQDVMARWHRMQNVPVLWIPGFDHAGIATQAVIEKHLAKTKNITKNDMSKEEFMKFIWDWKDDKSSVIREQLKQLGATLDWSKEFFTMSQSHNRAVIEAFLKLDEKKLLYRDKRLINWSPTLGSALSDIEVEYKEIKEKVNLELPGYKRKITFGQIYDVAYNLLNSDEKIVVSTTRPETICGDVAIAVHPNDDRYSKLIGQFVENPISGRPMPIVTDEGVKMDFGTGAVKITPAHDHFDYTVAKKHNLKLINIIDETGKMTSEAGSYAGLPRYFARHQILEELAQKGALRGTKDHPMFVPLCSRTGDVIEFLLKEQWYVDCKDMAQKAVKVVKNGSLKLDPNIHEKLWFEWLENVRDWCVSRQIWWGHQIPAFKCTIGSDTKWIIGRNEEEVRKLCLNKFGADNPKLEQDPDVLDTWFSSAILPFSTMGWPDKTPELDNFYPLSMMETGHDILYFWVARMVMLGLELTGQLPFKSVLLHGVLCSARGKKMSKSSGNVILPENVINGISFEDLNKQAKQSFDDGILSQSNLTETLAVNKKAFPKGIPECGVDALRLTIVSHNVKGRTVTFNDVECQVNKFFGNKIWQASRYVVLMTSDEPIKTPTKLNVIDEWVLSRLSLMVQQVNESLKKRMLNKAVTAIREFLHYEFCDYYVEGTKPGFKTENPDIVEAHRHTLAHCLEVSLRILSPFMPYLVDDLYLRLSEKLSLFSKYESVAQAPYPLPHEFEKYRNLDLEENMTIVMNAIDVIRKLLGNLSNKSEFKVYIVVDSDKHEEFMNANINLISSVGKTSNLEIRNSKDFIKTANCIWHTVGPSCNVYMEIEDAKHLEEVKSKIEKKRSQVKKKLETLFKKKSKLDSSMKLEDDKIQFVEQIESCRKELEKLPQF